MKHSSSVKSGFGGPALGSTSRSQFSLMQSPSAQGLFSRQGIMQRKPKVNIVDKNQTNMVRFHSYRLGQGVPAGPAKDPSEAAAHAGKGRRLIAYSKSMSTDAPRSSVQARSRRGSRPSSRRTATRCGASRRRRTGRPSGARLSTRRCARTCSTSKLVSRRCARSRSASS